MQDGGPHRGFVVAVNKNIPGTNIVANGEDLSEGGVGCALSNPTPGRQDFRRFAVGPFFRARRIARRTRLCARRRRRRGGDEKAQSAYGIRRVGAERRTLGTGGGRTPAA